MIEIIGMQHEYGAMRSREEVDQSAERCAITNGRTQVDQGETMRKVVGICMLAAVATGCATKNYGRQGALTDYEKQSLSCREIELEQAKVQGFIQHVNKESEFDGRSVLSFLGDFGIGNLMEKDSALKSANDRLADLQAASMQNNCRLASSPSSPQDKAGT